MSAFLLSTGLIFVAELGDKSQLVALWFATRYRWWVVLSGVTAATLVVHLGSVAIGRVIDQVLPGELLRVLVGLSFFGFAWWSLRGDSLDDDDTSERRVPWLGSFGVVAIAFFISELGDKTQLATVSIAGREPSFVPVWLGSTFGMVLADAVAVVVGIVAGKRLPLRLIGQIAAGLFVVFGALTIVSAFVDLGI
ncbi:MAG: TMEM165/GDT1 family protein [Chloroflexota bacterium]